jgi:hypothetical protein
MKNPKYKYPAIRIIWDDAESDAAWQDEPTAPLGPTLMLSIGFLIRDEPDYILMADTYELGPNTKMIGNTNKIPRGMIKEIQFLNVSDKKEPKPKRGKIEASAKESEAG